MVKNSDEILFPADSMEGEPSGRSPCCGREKLEAEKFEGTPGRRENSEAPSTEEPPGRRVSAEAEKLEESNVSLV